MAKKSKIARNDQRKVVVDRYAAKRLEEAAEHGIDGGLALSGRRSDLRDELGLVERLVSH